MKDYIVKAAEKTLEDYFSDATSVATAIEARDKAKVALDLLVHHDYHKQSRLPDVSEDTPNR